MDRGMPLEYFALGEGSTGRWSLVRITFCLCLETHLEITTCRRVLPHLGVYVQLELAMELVLFTAQHTHQYPIHLKHGTLMRFTWMETE